jgi:hypothetical protein
VSAPLVFCSARYERSHGAPPRGRGQWAFQHADNPDGFDRNLWGDVFFAGGSLTLTQAKEKVRRLGWTGYVAILP